MSAEVSIGHDGTGYLATDAVEKFWYCPDECYRSTEKMLDYMSEVMTRNGPPNSSGPPTKLLHYWVSLYDDRPIYIAGKRTRKKTYRDGLVLLGPSEKHIWDKWFRVQTESQFIIHHVDCAFDYSMQYYFEGLKPYLSGAVGSRINFQQDYTNYVTILQELYFEHEADAVSHVLRSQGHDEAI